MNAAISGLYRRAPVPLRLELAAVLAYVVSFAIMAEYGGRSLGLSGAFYIPVVLASLATGPLGGAAAGLAATLLYMGGLDVSVGPSADLLSARTAIHLITYVSAGLIVGLFASRARRLLGESLRVLDDLLGLARRDLGSGALSGDGFEAAVRSRLDRGRPFVLLVAELGGEALDDVALRRILDVVCAELGPEAEAGRIGPSQLAVLANAATLAAARLTASDVERALDAVDVAATFGWALYPTEGTDAFSLFRAASERLYGRRLVRGEWLPTPASVELVDELAVRAS